MLGDTAFPQFYPTVFVLVTEMLDHFGAPVHAPRTAPHHPAPPLTTPLVPVSELVPRSACNLMHPRLQPTCPG